MLVIFSASEDSYSSNTTKHSVSVLARRAKLRLTVGLEINAADHGAPRGNSFPIDQVRQSAEHDARLGGCGGLLFSGCVKVGAST